MRLDPCRTNSRALRWAILSGTSTFVAGFGAMNAFWFAGPRDESLRGLYDYWSATLGDGLALPLVAFGLAGACANVNPAKWRIWIAILGASLGVVTQATWLADPHPQLNWTFPETHRFNAAGWYHAAFMVGGGFAFGWLAGAVLPNLRDARIRDSLRGWLTLSIAGAFLFICTLALDNADILSNPSSQASLLLAALAGIIALGVLIRLWHP